MIIDSISRLAEDMLDEVDRRAALKKAMSLLTSKAPALVVAGAKAGPANDYMMVTCGADSVYIAMSDSWVFASNFATPRKYEISCLKLMAADWGLVTKAQENDN